MRGDRGAGSFYFSKQRSMHRVCTCHATPVSLIILLRLELIDLVKITHLELVLKKILGFVAHPYTQPTHNITNTSAAEMA